MTEQDIADYLKNHPDFFTHHPELLQQLTIPHSHEEGTMSLVEAQLAQQREQIKTLTLLLENFISLLIKKLISSLLSCLCRRNYFKQKTLSPSMKSLMTGQKAMN